MKRCDAALGALFAVIAVVVVGRDCGHPLLAKDANQPPCHGRLSGRRVADDAEDDGARHGSLLAIERSAQGRLRVTGCSYGPALALTSVLVDPSAPGLSSVSLKTELRRMSSASIVTRSRFVSFLFESNRRVAWRKRARSIALRMLRPWANLGRCTRTSM